MAAGNDSTSANALLKEYYSPDAVEIALFKEQILMGLVPKKEDVTGRYMVTPIVVGAGQGRSVNFATAQAMAALSGEVVVDFQTPLVENHETATIATKLVSQSMNEGPGAFLKAVTLISDDQLINLGNDVGQSLYRTADGNRGQIGPTTTLASSTLVLSNRDDVYLYEVGMQLDLALTQSSASIRAYGSGSHGLYVVGVDYSKGTLTVGTTPTPGGTPCNITDLTNGIPTAAIGDYIYATGDRNGKMSGLMDWIPQTDPATNDSFQNVNRSINRVRLAGQFLDARGGQSIASALETAMAMVASVGGKTSTFLMSHKKLAQLSIELGAKDQRIVEIGSTNTSVGYKGVQVVGPKGTAVCLGDQFCPSNRIFGLDLDTWELMSVGKAAHVWDEDGQVWLRSPTAAGMEIRFYSFAGLRCLNPRSNIHMLVTAA